MRRLVLFVAILVAVGLAGCASQPPAPPPPEVEVAVYLGVDATEAQRRAIEATLTATPGVHGVTFETSEQAYEQFKELFEDSPELVEAVTAEAFPASFRFTVAETAAEPFVTELEEMPGVDEVIMLPEATPSPTR